MADAVTKNFAGFNDKLVSQLSAQQKSGEFCDLVVNIDGEKFYTHRCILSANCPYIYREITTVYNSSLDVNIDLSGIVSKNVFKILLRYMYTGSLDFERSSLGDVKESANFLELNDVLVFLSNLEDALDRNIKVESNSSGHESDGTLSVDSLSVINFKNDNANATEDKTLKSKRKSSDDKNINTNAKKVKTDETTEFLISDNNADDNTDKKVDLKATIPCKEVVRKYNKLMKSKSRKKKSSTNKVKKMFSKLNLSGNCEVQESGDITKKKKKKRYRYKCDICPRIFKCLKKFEQHKTDHSSGALLECKVCGQNFIRKCDFTRHETKHMTVKCDQCPFETNSHPTFCKHYLTEHNQPKAFGCKERNCKYRFKRFSDLKKHEDLHETRKHRPFLCNNCGNDFTTEYSLKLHLQSCLMKLAYLCDFCGRKFNYQSSLESHKRMHRGEKPFLCTECPARFSDHGNLKRHKRIHSNIFPYICGFCEKGFRHSNTLKMHITKQHDPGFLFCLKDFMQQNIREVDIDENGLIDGTATIKFFTGNSTVRVLTENSYSGNNDISPDQSINETNINTIPENNGDGASQVPKNDNQTGSDGANLMQKINNEIDKTVKKPTKIRTQLIEYKNSDASYVCLKDTSTNSLTFIIGGDRNRKEHIAEKCLKQQHARNINPVTRSLQEGPSKFFRKTKKPQSFDCSFTNDSGYSTSTAQNLNTANFQPDLMDLSRQARPNVLPHSNNLVNVPLDMATNALHHMYHSPSLHFANLQPRYRSGNVPSLDHRFVPNLDPRFVPNLEQGRMELEQSELDLTWGH